MIDVGGVRRWNRGPDPQGPYRWAPEETLDMVEVAELDDEVRARVAADAYGDAALAGELEELAVWGRRGYRLRFELLQPEWRARWQAAMPAAVLRRGVRLDDRPAAADDSFAYDPTAALGEPIGALGDILRRPGNFRHVLDRDEDTQVVVMLDGGSEHLAAHAMTFQERDGRRRPLPPLPPLLEDEPARGRPPRLTLDGGDGQRGAGLDLMEILGRRRPEDERPADPFAEMLAPARLGPRGPLPTALRQMSVGELRDLVRRHGAQSRLADAGVQAPELVDAVASERFVTATGRDGGAHVVDTGSHDQIDVAPVGPQSAAPADPAATLDRFDLAIATSELAAAGFPALADLLAALTTRLRTMKDQLEHEPGLAAIYAPVIELQIEVAEQSQRALAMMPLVLARFPEGNPLHGELQAIANLYELALVYSDRGAEARRFYDEADGRMTRFPVLQMRTLADTHQGGIAAILADRGDDLAVRDLGITATRDDMRAAAAPNQQLDARQMSRALADAEAAALAGDPARAQRCMEVARFHLAQMEGRHRLLGQLHQALIAYQQLAHSGALVTHPFVVSDDDLVTILRGLHGLHQRYEANPDPAARAQVLAELDGLWASEQDFQDFYEHIHDVAWWSDFGVNLLLLVVSVVLGGGLAAVARGALGAAAATTAGQGGVLVLEALVFTGVARAGDAVMEGHEQNRGLAGFVQEERNSFGEDFAWNLGLFMIMRSCGRLWSQLGATAQLAGSFAVFEAYAVTRFGVDKGRLPSLDELSQMTLENAAALLVCHATHRMSASSFRDLESRTREDVRGDYRMTLGGLETQRIAIETELAAVLERGHDGGQVDRGALGALMRRSAELGRRFADTLDRMAADPRNSAAERAGLAEAAQGNRALTDRAGDLAFAARVGWRPVGESAALVNPSAAPAVIEHFRGRGCTVDVRQTSDGRSELRISGEGMDGTLVVRESRTAGETTLVDGWARGAEPNAEQTVAEARRLLGELHGPRAREAAAAGDLAIELVDGTGFALRTGADGHQVIELGRDAAELRDARLVVGRIVHERAHAATAAERGGRDADWRADERHAYQAEYEALRELTGGDLAEFADLVTQRFGRQSFDLLLRTFGERYRALLAEGRDAAAARDQAYEESWDAFEREILPQLETGSGRTYDEHYAEPGAAPQGERGLPRIHRSWLYRLVFNRPIMGDHRVHLDAPVDEFASAFAAVSRDAVRAILAANQRHGALDEPVIRRALIEYEYGGEGASRIARLREVFDALGGSNRAEAEAQLRELLTAEARRSLDQRIARRQELGLDPEQFRLIEQLARDGRGRRFEGHELTLDYLSAMSEAQRARVRTALDTTELRDVRWHEQAVDLGAFRPRALRYHGTTHDPPATVIANGGLRAYGEGHDLAQHVIEDLPNGLRGTADQLRSQAPGDQRLLTCGPITFAEGGGWIYAVHRAGIDVETAHRYRPRDTPARVVEKVPENENEVSIEGNVPLADIEGWYTVGAGRDGSPQLGEFTPNPAFVGERAISD